MKTLLLFFARRQWTEDGVMYRRAGYVILKPTATDRRWRLRKVNGQRYLQLNEGESDFMDELRAFRAGNKVAK